MDYKERFKKLLSIPSEPRNEWLMINHIKSLLDDMDGVEYTVEDNGNILVTKGVLEDGNLYPLIMAHTDTVHRIPDDPSKIEIHEEEIENLTIDSWSGNQIVANRLTKLWATYGNKRYGCGGDDKCGVHICLEILRTTDKPIKVAFFVSEEIGMLGSQSADPNFFTDISYGMEFDAPFNDLITSVCSGVRLFDTHGEFGTQVLPKLRSTNIDFDLQSHPFTDVLQMKSRFAFDCINFSSGYYNMHRPNEFIILEHTQEAQALAEKVLNELPTNKKYIS